MNWFKELIEDNKYVYKNKGLMHLLKIWFILIFVTLPIKIVEVIVDAIAKPFKMIHARFKK